MRGRASSAAHSEGRWGVVQAVAPCRSARLCDFDPLCFKVCGGELRGRSEPT